VNLEGLFTGKGGGEMPEDAAMDFGDVGDLAPPPSSRHDSEGSLPGLTPADREGLDPLVADDGLSFPGLEVADSVRSAPHIEYREYKHCV